MFISLTVLLLLLDIIHSYFSILIFQIRYNLEFYFSLEINSKFMLQIIVKYRMHQVGNIKEQISSMITLIRLNKAIQVKVIKETIESIASRTMQKWLQGSMMINSWTVVCLFVFME